MLDPAARSVFTGRELVVIDLLARGFQTKQIAREIGLGEEAVRDRIDRARRRSGCETRAQLVAVYLTRKRTPKKVRGVGVAGVSELQLWTPS